MRRVQLTANIDNTPSIRVAEKAGFLRESTLRKAALDDEGPHDVAVFSRQAGDGSRTAGNCPLRS